MSFIKQEFDHYFISFLFKELMFLHLYAYA